MRHSQSLCFILIYLFSSLHLWSGQLTVEDIFGTSKFSSNLPKGVTWRSGHDEISYFDKDSATEIMSIKLFDAKQAKTSVLITSEDVDVLSGTKSEKRFTLPNYIWSPDGKSLLLPCESDLYYYTLKTRKLERLTEDTAEERDPAFSPDGTQIAWIKHDNLYCMNLDNMQTRALTSTGSETRLIGRFDWVYEEEFEIRTAYLWSPDSRYIAFYEIDMFDEITFPIVDYVPVINEVEEMRYPKAGSSNAAVRIGVVNIETGLIRFMRFSDNTDIYIPRIQWLPDSRTLAVQRLSRDQNQLDLIFTDIETGVQKTVLTETDPNGWVDIFECPVFFKEKDQFVWISERDNRTHLYLYKNSGEMIRQITTGPWDVTEIVYLNEKDPWIYFTGTLESSTERHLYRIRPDGGRPEKLTQAAGTHQLKMAPSGKYYMDRFSSVSIPPQISIHDSHGFLTGVLADGKIDALNKVDLVEPVFFTFQTEDGLKLNAMLYQPEDFDKSKKYPVLINVYGGPGSQIVTNSWRRGQGNLWHQLLLQKGYLIFSVDNRGTGFMGDPFKNSVYKNMSIGLDDQIAAVRYLQKLNFVDPDRIGIWGWSGGGWMTAMALTKGAPLFKAGIAVAPVTDFRNYDTIWTERYMDQPDDNPEGYKASCPATFIDNYRGGLLIIHGTADDNVHLSNTMQFVYQLQNARKPFAMMLYPRKLHGIGGRDTRVHLYNMMTDFILKNL